MRCCGQPMTRTKATGKYLGSDIPVWRYKCLICHEVVDVSLVSLEELKKHAKERSRRNTLRNKRN